MTSVFVLGKKRTDILRGSYQSGGLEIFHCLFYVNLREIDNRNLCIIMVRYKFLIDSMGGLYPPGVPVRADPRGGDGLRVCRGPEDLHGVRRVHAPALHVAPKVLRGWRMQGGR